MARTKKTRFLPQYRKNVKCEYCSKKFISKTRKENHVNEEHVSVKKLPKKCEFCDLKFTKLTRPKYIKSHIDKCQKLLFDKENATEDEKEEWIDIPDPELSDDVICFHENKVKIVKKCELPNLFPGKEIIPHEVYKKKFHHCTFHYI